MDTIIYSSHEEKRGEATWVFPALNDLEENLLGGYKFKNKLLLEEALTHHSLPGCRFSYERLEYIGDSVLNLMFTNEHYFKYPNEAPGVLTRLRAANVDTEKLARVAIKHEWHRYLRHNKPLLQGQIEAFTKDASGYLLHSRGLIEVPKVLADIVESLVGAVFVDCNSSIDIVWEVFKKLLEPIITLETLWRHPVTELYEMCQKENLKLRFFDLWKKQKMFIVLIDGELIGTGICANKKEIAHNRAAKDALDNIDIILSKRSSIGNIITMINEGRLIN